MSNQTASARTDLTATSSVHGRSMKAHAGPATRMNSGPIPRRCVRPMKTNIKVKKPANSAASPLGTRTDRPSSLATSRSGKQSSHRPLRRRPEKASRQLSAAMVRPTTTTGPGP